MTSCQGPEEHSPPPPLDYVPKPIYPEYMPQEDEVFLAEEHPLPTAASPTAQSPDYVPESDPEADLEEDDDEDPEEDPVDYPADEEDDGDDEVWGNQRLMIMDTRPMIDEDEERHTALCRLYSCCFCFTSYEIVLSRRETSCSEN
ncbi:hypothetical protein Tco_1393927 [Tanacetum coccineum]